MEETFQVREKGKEENVGGTPCDDLSGLEPKMILLKNG